MAAALRLLLSPEPVREAPPPARGSRSGTYAIVLPRAGRRNPQDLQPRVRAGDEEPFPAAWFEELDRDD